MPKITYHLKLGSNDPIAAWLVSTMATEVANYFTILTGDTTSVSCPRANLSKENQMLITSTVAIGEPQVVADQIKQWVHESRQLASYDFVIKIDCYDESNRKISVTSIAIK